MFIIDDAPEKKANAEELSAGYPKRMEIAVKSHMGVEKSISVMVDDYVVRHDAKRVMLFIFDYDRDPNLLLLKDLTNESKEVQDPTDGKWCSSRFIVAHEGVIANVNLHEANKVAAILELKVLPDPIPLEETRNFYLSKW